MHIHIWCGPYAYDPPKMGIQDFCHWLGSSEMLLDPSVLQTQTSDITNDVICAQTTHAAYCHWTAINSYARMFYAWTMYFRYKDGEILMCHALFRGT